MLDLTQIDNATAEDKSFKLDYWARLFRAKTWESAGCPVDIRSAPTGTEWRLHMLAQENPIMAEATNTIRKLTDNESIREACYRRDVQLAHESFIKRQLIEKDVRIAENEVCIAEKDARIAELEKQLEELKSQIK